MGAVRTRVQTADAEHYNNPQVIHMTPVHQLMSCEVKRLVFVRNKSIINAFKLFAAALAKLPSSKHNIAFSREKKSTPSPVILSHQNTPKNHFGLFQKWFIFHWRKHARLWIENSNFSQKQWFEVKWTSWWICFLQTQVFANKMLTDVLECGLCITCGLLWGLYQLFGLSFWRHPFTADDLLVNKWC